MKAPIHYYIKLMEMLDTLEQMRNELELMHHEVENEYDSMSESKQLSDYGSELEDIVDNLDNACFDELDNLRDCIDGAAFGFRLLPLADGYPNWKNALEEYEEMKALDEKYGTNYKAVLEQVELAHREDIKTEDWEDDTDIDEEEVQNSGLFGSMAGLAGAVLGWKIGSKVGFNREEEPKAEPKYYQGYSSDDPEWRDDDNDGFDDRDEANDGLDDRDGSDW